MDSQLASQADNQVANLHVLPVLSLAVNRRVSLVDSLLVGLLECRLLAPQLDLVIPTALLEGLLVYLRDIRRHSLLLNHPGSPQGSPVVVHLANQQDSPVGSLVLNQVAYHLDNPLCNLLAIHLDNLLGILVHNLVAYLLENLLGNLLLSLRRSLRENLPDSQLEVQVVNHQDSLP